MFDAEIIKFFYVGIFVAGVLVFFRVKYLIKKYYPSKHDDIFGKSLFEYSASNSMKIISFSLSKKNWRFIREPEILFWLKLYRGISLIFYSIIVLAVVYMIVVVVIEIIKR